MLNRKVKALLEEETGREAGREGRGACGRGSNIDHYGGSGAVATRFPLCLLRQGGGSTGSSCGMTMVREGRSSRRA